MKKYVPHDNSKQEVNWSKAKPVVFPNLKPSSTAISLRIPNTILDRLKVAAHRRGVPYQSFIKMTLAESVERVPKRKRTAAAA